MFSPEPLHNIFKIIFINLLVNLQSFHCDTFSYQLMLWLWPTMHFSIVTSPAPPHSKFGESAFISEDMGWISHPHHFFVVFRPPCHSKMYHFNHLLLRILLAIFHSILFNILECDICLKVNSSLWYAWNILRNASSRKGPWFWNIYSHFSLVENKLLQ